MDVPGSIATMTVLYSDDTTESGTWPGARGKGGCRGEATFDMGLTLLWPDAQRKGKVGDEPFIMNSDPKGVRLISQLGVPFKAKCD